MLRIAFALLVCLTGSLAFAQEREESLVMSAGASSLHKYNVTLFSIASMNSYQFENSNPAGSSYNYFGINYKIDGDSKVALRLPFYFNNTGTDRYNKAVTTDARLADIHVAYVMYDLGYIGDIDLSGNVKYYLPTSERGQDSKSLGGLRFELYAEYYFTRFSSITYGIKPQINFHTQKAFQDKSVPEEEWGFRDPRKTNKIAAFEHFIEVVADVNRIFSLKPRVAVKDDWYYASAEEELEGSQVTKIQLQLGLEIRAKRGLNFTVGIANESNLGTYKGKEVAFFRPENVSYSLMTNAFLF
ncbi:hypothetical protein D3C87_124060 [compost metagenome]